MRYMLARRVCRRDPLPRRLETIHGRGPELVSGEESTPGRRGANLWQESVRPKGGVLLARHAERRQKGKREWSSLFNSFISVALDLQKSRRIRGCLTTR